MADTMIARPSAAVPVPAEDVPSDAAAPAAKEAAKSKAAAPAANQPRKVRFNVGTNYKVLEIIGEGVCTAFTLLSMSTIALGAKARLARFDFLICSRRPKGLWRRRICYPSPIREKGGHQEDRSV